MKILILVSLVFLLGVGILKFIEHDKFPNDYSEIQARIEGVETERRVLIQELLDQKNPEKKREIAKRFIQSCPLWRKELMFCLRYFKKHKTGHTMRIVSHISASIYQVKQRLGVLQESQRMLENALLGIIDPGDRALKDYDPDQPFRKLFKNVKTPETKMTTQ
jgi:hypothetical protein